MARVTRNLHKALPCVAPAGRGCVAEGLPCSGKVKFFLVVECWLHPGRKVRSPAGETCRGKRPLGLGRGLESLILPFLSSPIWALSDSWCHCLQTLPRLCPPPSVSVAASVSWPPSSAPGSAAPAVLCTNHVLLGNQAICFLSYQECHPDSYLVLRGLGLCDLALGPWVSVPFLKLRKLLPTPGDVLVLFPPWIALDLPGSFPPFSSQLTEPLPQRGLPQARDTHTCSPFLTPST